ncbi:MAG: sigma-70 family RNA polymerase sigma factor [Myxococcota bacterium]
MADLEINRLWIRGDREALGLAHTRYRSKLEAVSYRILKNHADAEDVVQRVFVAVGRVTGKGTASLWTYLYRSAVNGSLSVLRARKQRLTLETQNLEHLIETGPKSVVNSEAQLLGAEMIEAVSRALLKVAPKYRQVLTLRIVWNLSNGEIAQREGIPVATARTQLRRGREELRKHLAPMLRDLGRTSQ